MSDLEQIEQEIRAYVNMEKNLKPDDRVKYLMNIIKKHDDVNRMEHITNYEDLMDMISYAKSHYSSTTIPMKVSRREVHSQEAVYVLVLEAFVAYLNKNKILRRLVRFDHDSQRR